MRSCMLVAALGFSAILANNQALAAKPNKTGKDRTPSAATSSAAEGLIEQALRAEAAGQLESRDSLLEQAIEADPHCAAAHWHQGMILVDGKWLTIEEATKQATASGKIFEYNNRRAITRDTPAEQLALADWCRQQGLKEQLRAHALQALSANPEMAEARRVLDLYPVNGRWLTESEIVTQRRQAKDEEAAVAAWMPRLKGWLRTAAKSERTRAQIREIGDPAAIPAIERVLSTKNNDSALLAVAAISNMKGQEATASLVRHAVLSPWEDVRTAAAEALQPRSLFSYAPLLLAGLEFPLEVEYAGIEQGVGSWCYRCQLFREGPMADTALDRTLRMQRFDDPIVSVLPGDTDENVIERARSVTSQNSQLGLYRTTFAADGTASAVVQSNTRTAFINSRIDAALAVATADSEFAAGARSGPEPKVAKSLPVNDRTIPRNWWNRWHDYNDIYYTDSRPVTTMQQNDRQVQMPRYSDCFVAGTLVWTRTGALAIELAKPGDLVLAQHSETGELAYKPVLATTVRPPVSLLKLSMGDATLIVTKGHPLWVSGKGWRMARELAVGDSLHTATGAIAVTAIGPAPKAVAYSLVVDGFNTYFAGSAKILAHDNNLREPTDAVVPGLVLQQ